MGFGTKISYCHATFSPWYGCTKVSPGCEHCFAERWAKRTGMVRWGKGETRRRASENAWKQPLIWNRKAEQAETQYRVLTDLCDVFDSEVEDRWRTEFFHLTLSTRNLDWLVLTKRIYAAKVWLEHPGNNMDPMVDWNVWLGCSVCNQEEADKKIPVLQSIPAFKRWLSIEPLLGPIDLKYAAFNGTDSFGTVPGIDWVVCGCESGPGARPMNIDWVRDLRDQCVAAKVPFYFKQGMVDGKLVVTPELDGRQWVEIPLNNI